MHTHKLISLVITLIGITMLAFMIIVEDEPGALPLLLIALGAAWYVIARFKNRSQQA